ncbi:TRICHOME BIREFRINGENCE-LIKE 11 [Euphorbia peplus]|nr:TRICHOME BIREFRINGENCE-LIKE 11 [Euphorbia peplus]
MSKISQSHQEQELLLFFEHFKKLKRFKFFEPSIGILGFFLVSICLICCFFFLDFRAVITKVPVKPQRFMLLQFNGSGLNTRVDFLGEKGDGCNLFDGEWVWDEKYPLYQSKDCRFLDEGFRCSENGRPDLFYTKWRWQPKLCNLPRFDAKMMLEKLRNKRVVFAGDSIGRNQWESLMCLLSSAVTNKDSIYEVNGSPITKHKGFLVFKFKDYNCTVEYYRAPFLVLQSRPPSNISKEVRLTLKLDRMDWNSNNWRSADMLVLNMGHWYNYEKTIKGGTYFQEGTKVKFNMSVEEAYKNSIETVIQWIHKEVNSSKTQVFFRTFAPVHFRGGDWRTGGTCHFESLPEIGFSLVPSEIWTHYKIATDVLATYSNQTRKFDILNITHMTAQRKDGHSSLYYNQSHKTPLRRQDCSHWCLPGVPDSWNELVYAMFLKHQTRKHNLSSYVAQS